MRRVVYLAISVALLAVAGAVAQEVAVFKSGVERVTVAATVRDARGRMVTDLEARDFELFDAGHARPLLEVWSEPSPASVAILMDASGSMATKMARARETARALASGLFPGTDEVGFYTFDTMLQQVRPFSTQFDHADGPLDATQAFGATSLWDAIASTAQQIADRRRRRALVVITDGVDSASRMKPSDVSGIASELDVPVYVLVITFAPEGDPRDTPAMRGPLADLAAWTGGDSLLVRDALSAASVSRQVVTELHHQYMIAFEPGSAAGWHPLTLRLRKPGLFVRARSGYMVR